MKTQLRTWLGWGAVGLAYWASRLPALTNLPVFADEAIYIRWAQMIANEPQKYLFLPMYDGKPPLHMWLLTRFLPLTPLDPLWAGRFMSVAAGFLTLILIILIVKELGGKGWAQYGSAILYILLPFTFFHDRIALIDPLYVFLLTATFLSLIILKKTSSRGWVFMAGLFYGLAFMTKTPALFFGLIFPATLVLIPPRMDKQKFIQTPMYFAAAGLIGIGIFYLLKVSELFPFLFNRSNDFGFGVSQILNGEWRRSLINLNKFWLYTAWYMTIPLFLLPIIGYFFDKKSRQGKLWAYLPISLLILSLVYAAPFIILGKIVYSRYYYPLIIFLIPAAAIALERLILAGRGQLVAFLGGLIVIQAVWFAYPWYTDVGKAHLPADDISQYLTEWSAGFGNREVRDYLTKAAQLNPVAAATEGYFGTLPDGLLMYFDKSPLIPQRRIEVYGIGQPVSSIPDSVREKAKTAEVYIVVNENRLDLDPKLCCEIVGTYPRPLGGAPLLLLKYMK
jgi:4-amino-4-deoxy-L-arabinose transferase-like glycosyltransferase